MALALATGIPASVWAEEGEQAIVTAVDMLEQRAEKHKRDDDGRQMSG